MTFMKCRIITFNSTMKRLLFATFFLWNERYKNSHLFGKYCETPQKMHSGWTPLTAISQTKVILSEQTSLESKKSKQLCFLMMTWLISLFPWKFCLLFYKWQTHMNKKFIWFINLSHRKVCTFLLRIASFLRCYTVFCFEFLLSWKHVSYFSDLAF